MLISYFLSHVNLPKNTLYLLTNKVFPIFLLYKLRKKLIPKKKKKKKPCKEIERRLQINGQFT